MEGLIARVHAEFGSWLGYAERIGVSEELVMALRDSLLEEDAA